MAEEILSLALHLVILLSLIIIIRRKRGDLMLAEKGVRESGQVVTGFECSNEIFLEVICVK